MADERSPTLRRRELGQRLRELRQLRDLTLEQVADQLLFSSAKLSRLETGARGATLRDIRDLCNLYEVEAGEYARLLALARESKERAWWQEYDVPYGTYIGLEQEATRISEYNPGAVPGLLQTKAYATALMEGTNPKGRPADTEQLVNVRITRQLLIQKDDPPQLWVVVDEAALHRVVGNPETMYEQLGHLVETAGLPHVHIQVLAFGAGAYPGLNNPFIILDLGRSDAADIVHTENLHGFFYLERPGDLERYRSVFDQLRAIALSPRDSQALITHVRQGYT